MVMRADLPPGPDDREALLAMLADVMQELGWQHFVRAPIVLPTDAFFPDAPARDLSAVGAIAGRVASYAGLEERAIEIAAPKDVSLDDLAMLEARASAPDVVDDAPASTIFLAEVDDGVARLGVEASALTLRSGPGLVAEVARALVAAELVDAEMISVDEVDDAGEIDVACVALGLGVIVTNAGLRVRRRHREIVGRSVISRDEIDVVTARAPHELAFLLAAQVVVRGDDCDAIAALLEPDQRAAFLASTKLLEREALLRALQLPPVSEWPVEVALEEADVRVVTPEGAAMPQGGKVLRVRIARRPEGAFTGAMLGMSSFVGILYLDSDLGLAGLGLWGAMIVAGAVIGVRRRADVCSRRECRAPLPIGATTCSACAGVVEGECVPRKLLEAEEELEARVESRGYRDPAR